MPHDFAADAAHALLTLASSPADTQRFEIMVRNSFLNTAALLGGSVSGLAMSLQTRLLHHLLLARIREGLPRRFVQKL